MRGNRRVPTVRTYTNTLRLPIPCGKITARRFSAFLLVGWLPIVVDHALISLAVSQGVPRIVAVSAVTVEYGGGFKRFEGRAIFRRTKWCRT